MGLPKSAGRIHGFERVSRFLALSGADGAVRVHGEVLRFVDERIALVVRARGFPGAGGARGRARRAAVLGPRRSVVPASHPPVFPLPLAPARPALAEPPVAPLPFPPLGAPPVVVAEPPAPLGPPPVAAALPAPPCPASVAVPALPRSCSTRRRRPSRAARSGARRGTAGPRARGRAARRAPRTSSAPVPPPRVAPLDPQPTRDTQENSRAEGRARHLVRQTVLKLTHP